ncbi:hypothetical protein ACHAWF_016116 [Thalassiosira exigua]
MSSGRRSVEVDDGGWDIRFRSTHSLRRRRGRDDYDDEASAPVAAHRRGNANWDADDWDGGRAAATTHYRQAPSLGRQLRSAIDLGQAEKRGRRRIRYSLEGRGIHKEQDPNGANDNKDDGTLRHMDQSNNRQQKNTQQQSSSPSQGGFQGSWSNLLRLRSLNNLKSEVDNNNNNNRSSSNNDNNRSSNNSQGWFHLFRGRSQKNLNDARDGAKLTRCLDPVVERQGDGDNRSKNNSSSNNNNDNHEYWGMAMERSHSTPVTHDMDSGERNHHRRQGAGMNDSWFHRTASMYDAVVAAEERQQQQQTGAAGGVAGGATQRAPRNRSGRSSGRSSSRRFDGPVTSIRQPSTTSTVSELSLPSQLLSESMTLWRDAAMENSINCTREQIRGMTLNAASREAAQATGSSGNVAWGEGQRQQLPALRRSAASRTGAGDTGAKDDKLSAFLDAFRGTNLNLQRQGIPEEPAAATSGDGDVPRAISYDRQHGSGAMTGDVRGKEDGGRNGNNEGWGAVEDFVQRTLAMRKANATTDVVEPPAVAVEGGRGGDDDVEESELATSAQREHDGAPSQGGGSVPQSALDKMIELKLRIAEQQSVIDAQTAKLHNLKVEHSGLVREVEEENGRLTEQIRLLHQERDEESQHQSTQSPRSVASSTASGQVSPQPSCHESAAAATPTPGETVPAAPEMGRSTHDGSDDDEVRLLRSRNEVLTRENEDLSRNNFKLTVTNLKLDAKLNEAARRWAQHGHRRPDRPEVYRQPLTRSADEPRDDRDRDIEALCDKNHELKRENLKLYCELEVMKKSMDDLQSLHSRSGGPSVCHTMKNDGGAGYECKESNSSQLVARHPSMQNVKTEMPRTSSFGWY